MLFFLQERLCYAIPWSVSLIHFQCFKSSFGDLRSLRSTLLHNHQLCLFAMAQCLCDHLGHRHARLHVTSVPSSTIFNYLWPGGAANSCVRCSDSLRVLHLALVFFLGLCILISRIWFCRGRSSSSWRSVAFWASRLQEVLLRLLFHAKKPRGVTAALVWAVIKGFAPWWHRKRPGLFLKSYQLSVHRKQQCLLSASVSMLNAGTRTSSTMPSAWQRFSVQPLNLESLPRWWRRFLPLTFWRSNMLRGLRVAKGGALWFGKRIFLIPIGWGWKNQFLRFLCFDKFHRFDSGCFWWQLGKQK